jgi:signal peptide peptidase SppA
MKQRRYKREGLLALDPRACFGLFGAPRRESDAQGNVAVVSIRGPLNHHAGWFDSYDEILQRVQEALESSAAAVVMKFDSPGGDVSGMVETARSLRAKSLAAKKPLIAYVDEQAGSAAYALACAAERIVVPSTGFVGSIGIINMRVDASAAAKQGGVGFYAITSGARKADGHPQIPMTEAELLSTQSMVDSIANTFFELVEELRGVPAEDSRALQARIFHGAAAVKAGLADEVMSFEELLASIASADGDDAMRNKPKGSKYSEGRAALEEAAKGEGEEAEKAKRAIAAMDGDDEPAKDDEAEGDEPPADDEPAKDDEAEGDEPPADDEPEPKKDKEARARGTVRASTAGELATMVAEQNKRLAAMERRHEAAERKEFLATRPDLDADLVKYLETKPLAEVKSVVNAIKRKAPKLAGTIAPNATRGAGQGDGETSRLSAEKKLELDTRMGLVAPQTGIKSTDHKLTLGAPVSSAAGAK